MKKELTVLNILKRLSLFSFFVFSILIISSYKDRKEQFASSVFTIKRGTNEALRVNNSYSKGNYMRFIGTINDKDSVEYAIELKNIIETNNTRIKYYKIGEFIPIWYHFDTKKVQMRVYDDKIKNIEFLEKEQKEIHKIEFVILFILGFISLIFTLINYFLK